MFVNVVVRRVRTPQPGPGKPPHRRAVIESLFRHRIARCIPALQEIHKQHHLQKHRPPPALRPRLRILRRDQRQKPTPGHHRVRRCARNSSPRVSGFFIASRRLGKAGCFGIGRAPCRDAQFYRMTPKVAGFSDAPQYALVVQPWTSKRDSPAPQHRAKPGRWQKVIRAPGDPALLATHGLCPMQAGPESCERTS